MAEHPADTRGIKDVGTPIVFEPTTTARDAELGGMTYRNAPVGMAPAEGRAVLSDTRGGADIGAVKVKK